VALVSTHVVPKEERFRHLLTMECPCRPVQQAALGLDVGSGGAVAAADWVIMHHELASGDRREAEPR
jgi:hypothetical protein